MMAARTPRQSYAYNLHFRQHYALSTSDDPDNAKWKQRSSCGFPGKIMVYPRQRYALNHSRPGLRQSCLGRARPRVPFDLYFNSWVFCQLVLVHQFRALTFRRPQYAVSRARVSRAWGVGGGEKGYQFGGRKGASGVVTLWPFWPRQRPLKGLCSFSWWSPVWPPVFASAQTPLGAEPRLKVDGGSALQQVAGCASPNAPVSF